MRFTRWKFTSDTHEGLTESEIEMHRPGIVRSSCPSPGTLRKSAPRWCIAFPLWVNVDEITNCRTVEMLLIDGLRSPDTVQFGWPIGGTDNHRDERQASFHDSPMKMGCRRTGGAQHDGGNPC